MSSRLALVAAVVALAIAGAAAAGNATNVTVTVTADFVLAVNNTLPVCQASMWLKSPVLIMGAAPLGTFQGALHWKGKQAVSYAKTQILPAMYANAAFFVLALITLIVILIWRIARCCYSCCQACCCPPDEKGRSCEEVLTSKVTWVYKIIMMVLGVATLAICIYGMAVAKEDILGPGWSVADDLVVYFTRVSAAVNALLVQIATISPAMDRMTQLGTVECQAPVFLNTYVPTMSAYLDDASNNPTTLVTKLATLTTQLAVLSTVTTAVITDMGTTLPTLWTATQSVDTYGTSTYNAGITTALNALTAPLAAITDNQPDTTKTGNLLTAMNNAPVSNWITNLNAVSAAVVLIKASTTPTTALADITSLNTQVTAMSSITATSSAGGAVTTFNTHAITNRPFAAWIMNTTNHINTTVVRLNSTADKTIVDMRNLVAALDAFTAQSPSPAALASALSTLLTSLTMPSSMTTLQAYLNTLSTDISSSPSTSTLVAYLSQVTTQLTTYLTPFDATYTALLAYNSGGRTTALGTTLLNSITPGSTATSAENTNAIAAMSSPLAVPATLATWATAASNMDNTLSSASTSRAAMQTSATTMQTNGAAVPSPSTYSSSAAAVVTVYIVYPPQRSLDLLPLSVQIQVLNSATVQVPIAIKAGVVSAIGAFSGAAQQLTEITVDKVSNFETKWKPKVAPYVKIRYQVVLGLYGLIMLFMLLSLFFAAINCRLGMLIFMSLLLVFVALNFIFAVVWSAILKVEDDLCYNLEDALVSLLPQKYVQLIAYYIWDYGGDVRAALSSTGIINIDTVEAQATNANVQIYNVINQAFVPLTLMTSVLNQIFNATTLSINATNNVIDLASYENVNPVYIAVKSFVCCGLPDELNTMWIGETFGGVAAMLCCWFGMLLVCRLDILWRHAGCFGWRGLHPRLQWNYVSVSPTGTTDEDGNFKPDMPPAAMPPMSSAPSGPMFSAPSSDPKRPLLDFPNQHADSAASPPSYSNPAFVPSPPVAQGVPASPMSAANSAYQRQVEALNASSAAYFGPGGSPVGTGTFPGAVQENAPVAAERVASVSTHVKRAPSISDDDVLGRGNVMSASGNSKSRSPVGREEVVADEGEEAPLVSAPAKPVISDHTADDDVVAEPSGPRHPAELGAVPKSP